MKIVGLSACSLATSILFIGAAAVIGGGTPGSRATPAAGDRETEIKTFEDDRGIARSLAVTISTTKRRYRQLEPIIVDFEARNVDPGRRPLSVMSYYYLNKRIYAYGRGPFSSLSERSPETFYSEMKCYVPRGGSGGSTGGHLPPDGVDRGRLVANLVNDMTVPGKYVIVVEIDFGYRDEDGWHPAVARSNPVRVEVLDELPNLAPSEPDAGPRIPTRPEDANTSERGVRPASLDRKEVVS